MVYSLASISLKNVTLSNWPACDMLAPTLAVVRRPGGQVLSQGFQVPYLWGRQGSVLGHERPERPQKPGADPECAWVSICGWLVKSRCSWHGRTQRRVRHGFSVRRDSRGGHGKILTFRRLLAHQEEEAKPAAAAAPKKVCVRVGRA